jgi:hypothetical protein
MSRKLAERLQLDKPLAYALSARFWQAISGPVTIALIIRSLSEDEQGVYYAIAGVVNIQAFFELGFLNVLISQAGHAHSAHEQALQSQDEEATASSAARMRALIQAANRWFAAASLLFAIAALLFGYYTLSRGGGTVDWQQPLWVIVPLAAITVYWGPSLAILEGCGFRELVYRFRFFQMICGSLAVWAALLGGLAIWALVIAMAVQVGWTAYVVLIDKVSFFSQFTRLTASDSSTTFSWVTDVLPQQWRMAATSSAYHLATQFLAIVVITYHTAAESGRLGMTLSITMAIQMLALAWVQTKYSLITSLHGKGQREQAGTLWRRTAVISSGLLVVAFTALILLIATLPIFQKGWEGRFILPWQLVVLGVGCLANHLIALQAFYVLARRANPFVFASLVGFLSTAVAVWVGGYYFATNGVLVAYMLGMAGLTLPLHSWSYRQFRNKSLA